MLGGVYIYSGLLLIVSWWVPYLPKSTGLTDFSNGQGSSNSSPVLAPRRLSHGPSPGHSNLVSDEVYICSSLLLMISCWLPYLTKGPTPDFNNGLGNDFNSDVSKQIAPARTKHSCGVISLDMLTSLGQSTIRLGRYGTCQWKEVYEEKRKRKKEK